MVSWAICCKKDKLWLNVLICTVKFLENRQLCCQLFYAFPTTLIYLSNMLYSVRQCNTTLSFNWHVYRKLTYLPSKKQSWTTEGSTDSTFSHPKPNCPERIPPTQQSTYFTKLLVRQVLARFNSVRSIDQTLTALHDNNTTSWHLLC